MRKIELLLWVLIILTTLIKIFYNSIDSTVFTFIFIILLAQFYMIFNFASINNLRIRDIFKESTYKKIEVKKIIIPVILGAFGFSPILVGTVFKRMHWKGSFEQLLFGLIIISIVLIATSVLFYKKDKNFFINIVLRIVVFGFIAVYFLNQFS